MKSTNRQPLAGLLLLLFLTAGAAAQSDWYDVYGTGLDHLRDGQWTAAEADFRAAIAMRRGPRIQAETYGLQVIDYLPYYWLGVALYNQGRFAESLAELNRSEEWNAVRLSDRYGDLQRTRNILRGLLADRARADSLAALARDLSRRDSLATRRTDMLTRLPERLRDTATANLAPFLDSLRDDPVTRPVADALTPVLQEVARQREADRASDTETAIADDFQTALTDFVGGDYQAALRGFESVARRDPGYRGVTSWIRRTRAEIAALGAAEPLRVETDTVRLTAEPVVVFATRDRETRSDDIEVRGTVRDDQGIAFIEFNLNGQVYRDAGGDTVRIRPTGPAERRGFDFALTMPLQPGRNTIFAVAHDTDLPPHRAVYELSVQRQPPLHRTRGFWLVAGAVLLLVAGGWAGNRYLKRRIAFVNKYNPYIAGAPVRNEKMFFGRETLLDRILNTLHHNSLMLHGPRRIGKTSLLHQLKQRLERDDDPDFHFVPVYIDLQGTPEARFFRLMMQDILDELKAVLPPDGWRLPSADATYSPRDFTADIRRVIESLQSPGERRPLKVVLLIDEVDQLNGYSDAANQKLRSVFMKSFADHLVAVMAGSALRKHWESEGSPWYNFFEEIPVGGIDRDAAEALLREPVRGIFDYEDAAVARILDESGCIPYRLQKFGVHLIARLIADRRRRVTLADVDAVRHTVSESLES